MDLIIDAIRAGYFNSSRLSGLVLLAVIPGLAAVFILATGVQEPASSPHKTPKASGIDVVGWKRLDRSFKIFLAIVVLFTLGNSSDAFLMLRAQTVGLSTTQIFLLVAAFSLVISVSSLPAGILSDYLGRRKLIMSAWLIYAVIYLGFGMATAAWHVGLLYIVYGLYYGAFQGAASALVADLVPSDRRGTAYGLFNAAIGVAAFPASLIAGFLWQWFSPAAPFYFGAGLAFVSSYLLLLIPEKLKSSGSVAV